MKHLVSKMSKLEVENRPAARPPPDGLNRNPMPFRRPFPPQQILQRERRNLDDQRVQRPLNNFVNENQQDLQEGQEEINQVGGHSIVNYLTQEEYENQLMIHQFCDSESEIMANNESNQQTDSGRKYEPWSRQVPI